MSKNGLDSVGYTDNDGECAIGTAFFCHDSVPEDLHMSRILTKFANKLCVLFPANELRDNRTVPLSQNMDSLLQPVLFYENFIAPAIRVINPSFRTIININKKVREKK